MAALWKSVAKLIIMRQIVTILPSVQSFERLRECEAVVFAFASELPWAIIRNTHNRDREKSSGQANLFTIRTI